jgi:DNA-binding HxlR family transcriptional regulator
VDPEVTDLGLKSLDERLQRPLRRAVCGGPRSHHPPDDARHVQSGGPRVCSIADALNVVGDRWSLLILRELSFGVSRFADIRVNTGAPRETLTARLRKLENCGLIERQRYSEHPPRDEYRLTQSGTAIGPVLRELRRWGETYAEPSAR